MHRTRCIWRTAKSIRHSPAPCAAPPSTGRRSPARRSRSPQRLNALNDRIKAEQAKVTARQHGPGVADDDPQLQLAQAQLALDTDEADELHQTLIRLGGDHHALIQQALDEHEAVHKEETGTALSQTEAMETPAALTSLIGKLRASAHCAAGASSLSWPAPRRKRLPRNSSSNALSNDTETANASAGNAPATSDATTATARLRALAANREALTQYEHRIHDLETLANTYGKWDALVRAQERTILHRILRVFAFIIVIIGITILIDRLLQRLLTSRTRRAG
jgi:hypothetical protein